MKKTKKHMIWILALAVISLLMLSCARDRQLQTSYNVPEGSVGTVHNASQVIDHFVSVSGENIPPDVLKNAAGIAVIPDLTKAAFVAGGSYGSGVLLAHGEDQWSLPVFMSIAGGSLGLQIGISTTDLVLVFRNPETITKLTQGGKFSLGADVSVAAGPVGASADLSTINADVLAYSRSQGAFAGISLSGDVLSLDRDQTLDYYAAATPATEQQRVRGYYGERRNELFMDLLDTSKKVDFRNVPPEAAELKQTLDKLTD